MRRTNLFETSRSDFGGCVGRAAPEIGSPNLRGGGHLRDTTAHVLASFSLIATIVWVGDEIDRRQGVAKDRVMKLSKSSKDCIESVGRSLDLVPDFDSYHNEFSAKVKSCLESNGYSFKNWDEVHGALREESKRFWSMEKLNSKLSGKYVHDHLSCVDEAIDSTEIYEAAYRECMKARGWSGRLAEPYSDSGEKRADQGLQVSFDEWLAYMKQELVCLDRANAAGDFYALGDPLKKLRSHCCPN